ncbi:hypothetical protein [Bosea sp. 685]|uniref:hypothetical protein n=1 Tax=Bosea sp. 685 TaxID=3080057 RepID=UPI00289323D8|nr:hypothetical protein [Bosea sp. 685]WNJ89176.1 hypothetical protein RMR04_22560 [Bosea sp. 685]
MREPKELSALAELLERTKQSHAALEHHFKLNFPDYTIHHRKLLDQVAPPSLSAWNLPSAKEWEGLTANIFRNLQSVLEHPTPAQRVIAAGFLPHSTTPDLPEGDESTVRDFLEQHYRDNWPAVLAVFEASVDGFLLDEETRAVFREALATHGAGLYRATVRTLLPEIERVARRQFGMPTGGQPIPSLRALFRAMPLSAFGGMRNGRARIMTTFLRHVWKEIWTIEDLEVVQPDAVPNRSASLHGLTSYSSFQNSLNTLFVVECVFAMLSIHRSQTLTAPVVG